MVVRCSFRILPHKQNSGGFFVAVLHKKSPLRSGQNPSKSSAAVREPVSDKCTMSADQPEPVDTQNEPASAVLDSCSPAGSSVPDSAVAVVDHTSSDQPVVDHSNRPGWFSINMTICV